MNKVIDTESNGYKKLSAYDKQVADVVNKLKELFPTCDTVWDVLAESGGAVNIGVSNKARTLVYDISISVPSREQMKVGIEKSDFRMTDMVGMIIGVDERVKA